jgi:hypothetical protein
MPAERVLIVLARPGCGFFSLFFQVVGQLERCRRAGTVPLVYFNRQCTYWCEAGYRGARNAWEYYFEPVSARRITDLVDASLGQLESATIWAFTPRDTASPAAVAPAAVGTIKLPAHVVASDRYPQRLVPYLWRMSARRRRTLHRVIREGIRIRPEVTSRVESFYEANLGGREMLGVHIRARESSHGRTVWAKGGFLPLAVYLAEIDRYLDGHSTAAIFCASDSQPALDALAERYGSRVLQCEGVTRLDADEEASGQGLHLLDPERAHKGRLGEDVLVESLLLSRCDYLVHDPSNVSRAATLFNPDLPHTDVYRKYGHAFPDIRGRLAWLRYAAARRLRPWLRAYGCAGST